METSESTYYIDGFLNGNKIGTVDSDGKLNTSDAFDFDNRIQFETENEANDYVVRLLAKETEELHPDFEYRVEEWNLEYYNK